jgi:signal transduction histidine kinase
VLASGAALGLAQATAGLLGGAYLYFPLVAVFAIALWGGLGPGLTAVALCGLGFDFLFLGPPHRLGVGTADEAHRLLGFLLFGGAAAWLAARFQAARRSAERALAEAERATAEAQRVGALQERLVAVVSHDLRNPLGALKAGLDVLPRLGPLTDRQRTVAARMRGTVGRMERLIHDLLDLARTRQGRTLPVATAPARLGEICAGAIAEIAETGPRSPIELSVEGDDAGLLDASRLAQLVSNLVANAVAHGTLGAPVRVSVCGDGPDLHLEVENQGPAPPPDLLPRLFEPFQRGRRDGEGLGLGLFIVREIARAHGGEVSVRSGDGKTVFALRIPRRVA